MSGRIEGQSSSQVVEPQVETPVVQQAKPAVQVNRAEQAKQEEIAYAQGNPFASGRLRDFVGGIPAPGSAEFEVGGLVMHNGGKVKVTVDRDRDGNYAVTMNGGAQVGLHAFGEGVAAVDGSAVYKFRSAEAVADLLSSTAATTLPVVDTIGLKRIDHLNVDGLRQIEMGGSLMVGLRSEIPTVLGEATIGNRSSVRIDLDRRALVTETAVSGELSGRFGVLLAAANASGEVTAKIRTETTVSPELLEKLKSGQATASDVVQQSKARVELVIEAKNEEQFTTIASYAAAEQHKAVKEQVEITIDLTRALDRMSSGQLIEALQHPERFHEIAEGARIAKYSTDVRGNELQFMVGEARATAVRYQTVETPLFGEGSGHAMEQQLEAQRLKNAVAR